MMADAKEATRFRLSLACPVEGPRDSTWTAATQAADPRFRLSLACPVEGPRDSTWTAAPDPAFRLSLACPVEAPGGSLQGAAGTVDEAVAVQGGDFRLSLACPVDAPRGSLQPDGAEAAVEAAGRTQQGVLATDADLVANRNILAEADAGVEDQASDLALGAKVTDGWCTAAWRKSVNWTILTMK